MALYGKPPGVAWIAPPHGHSICRQCKVAVHCNASRCKGCGVITARGKRNHTIAHLAKIHGMSVCGISRRLSKGVPLENTKQSYKSSGH